MSEIKLDFVAIVQPILQKLQNVVHSNFLSVSVKVMNCVIIVFEINVVL